MAYGEHAPLTNDLQRGRLRAVAYALAAFRDDPATETTESFKAARTECFQVVRACFEHEFGQRLVRCGTK